MKLSEHGKKLLAKKMSEMFAKKITPKQYLIAVKAIYQTEAQTQAWEKQEYGYMAHAIN